MSTDIILNKTKFDVFVHFSKKFDDISDKLDKVLKSEDNPELDPRIIKDYINLCAEEYLWKEKKLIDDDVWESWSIAMREYFNETKVKRIIINQTEYAGSYYGFYSTELIENIVNQ